MEKSTPHELRLERSDRHNKLMKMISSYNLSEEEKHKLEKIKGHTMMEINLRFLRSQANRNYKFPKKNMSGEDQEDADQSPKDSLRRDKEEDKLLREELSPNPPKGRKGKLNSSVFSKDSSLNYDLRSQNQQNQQNQKSKLETFANSKFSSLEQSRRVHSLGNERSLSKERSQAILRRGIGVNMTKNLNRDESLASSANLRKGAALNGQSYSLKSLRAVKTRRQSKSNIIYGDGKDSNKFTSFSKGNTATRNLLIQNKKLKLPEIKMTKNQQNKYLKTQKRQEDIDQAIGKKLFTEHSQPVSSQHVSSSTHKNKQRGIERYLNQAEKKPIKFNKQIPGKFHLGV